MINVSVIIGPRVPLMEHRGVLAFLEMMEKYFSHHPQSSGIKVAITVVQAVHTKNTASVQVTINSRVDECVVNDLRVISNNYLEHGHADHPSITYTVVPSSK